MAYPLPRKYDTLSPTQKATVDSIQLWEVYNKFRPAMNTCGNCIHAIRGEVGTGEPNCHCKKHNVPVHGCYCCEDFNINPDLDTGRSPTETPLDDNMHEQPEPVGDPALEQSCKEHQQSDTESHHHTPQALNLQDDAVRQDVLCEIRQHKERKDKLIDDLHRAFQ